MQPPAAVKPPRSSAAPGSSYNRPIVVPEQNYLNTQGGRNPQDETPASVSWADDHVSDAELIRVSDGTIHPSHHQANGKPIDMTVPHRGSAPSGATRGAVANQAPKPPQTDRLGPNNGKGAKRGNDDGPELDDDYETYAEKASKYPWGVVENKRSKRNSADDNGMLLGVRSTPHKEIFVKHLDYSRCTKPADLEGRVKAYCRRKGVYILQARVFEQSDCNRANCRVSLKYEDVETALSPGFWPQHAVARIWSLNPQQDVANLNNGENDGIFDL